MISDQGLDFTELVAFSMPTLSLQQTYLFPIRAESHTHECKNLHEFGVSSRRIKNINT